jgi:hypothetical protein
VAAPTRAVPQTSQVLLVEVGFVVLQRRQTHPAFCIWLCSRRLGPVSIIENNKKKINNINRFIVKEQVTKQKEKRKKKENLFFFHFFFLVIRAQASE